MHINPEEFSNTLDEAWFNFKKTLEAKGYSVRMPPVSHIVTTSTNGQFDIATVRPDKDIEIMKRPAAIPIFDI